MKKIINYLILILFFASALFNAEMAYGDTEAEQSVRTTVLPTVTIKKGSSSIDNTEANAETGKHSGLNAVFILETNGTDDNCDFIISAKIITDEGAVPAYDKNGNILFAHTFNYPSNTDIENAKVAGNNNKNVIAYSTYVLTTSPFTNAFESDNSVYGSCYVVKVNGGQQGYVRHVINANPVSGTYDVGQDQAGDYQAIVTFSAISK